MFPSTIRPTQNKIRKAIFDCLGDFVKESSVLELFAGSGAVGIEALSCGAKEVTFVDNKMKCLRQIESNLTSLSITASLLYKKDSFKAIDFLAARGLKFDLIFLDPPYGFGYRKPNHSSPTYGLDLAKKSLLKISVCDILAPSGIVVLEHHQKEELPERNGSLILFKQKRYSDKVLSFYRRGGQNVPESNLSRFV